MVNLIKDPQRSQQLVDIVGMLYSSKIELRPLLNIKLALVKADINSLGKLPVDEYTKIYKQHMKLDNIYEGILPLISEREEVLLDRFNDLVDAY